jgi:Co/Zn/Cd efflux system component
MATTMRTITRTAMTTIMAATRMNAARIGIAALLTGGFMGVELAGGLIAGSLALIADAGHMLSDFGSLALAWIGFRMARRPRTRAALSASGASPC